MTLLALTGSARAEVLGLEGRVVLNQSPVSDAHVYAYQLIEKSLHKVLTDGSGKFLFEALPAGIYKLIAHKTGLQPAIQLLQRDAVDSVQFVELQLTNEATSDLTDFWSVRSEIPADVLRAITAPLVADAGDGSGAADTAPELANLVLGSSAQLDSRLLAEVSALSGVHDVTPSASARVNGANVGLKGQLGKVKLSMQGDFQTFESELAQQPDAGIGIDGQTHSVSFNVQTPQQGDFDISSSSNRMTMMDDSFTTPVEASQLYFGWNRPVGEGGATSVKASLVEESGLYNRAWIDPLGLPVSSRRLRVEGDYVQKFEGFGDLRAGLRYRENSGAYARRLAGSDSALLATQSLDAYGDGGWQAHEKVLVQYGLFTTMTDGSIAITPRGGFVLQMGPLWQTSLTAAHRVVSQENVVSDDFLPVVMDGTMTCGEAEKACYQMSAMRSSGVDSQLAMGASFRELDETVRMYFNGNFFESSEGIFLVPGDRLPEVHASLRQRLTPGIVAKVSASVASGGGGVFQSVNRRHYENDVSMVTSAIDATFERTSTGVYLSFHRLDQQLAPITQTAANTVFEPATDMQRLELVVSQNLSAIWDLSQDWAVHVGMGIARGASFFHSDVDPEAIQRRVVTGVAVRF
ncbi:MAG: carboxypeptidase-like regulatory domain-containing protein [Thermoanaerobaculia bacterium]